MKQFYFLILLLLVFSCKNEEKNKKINGKEYNPINEIGQTIQNPSSVKYFNIARSFNKTTEYDSVNHYLKTALNFEENPIIFNELGINEMVNNNQKKAIEYYKKGIEKDSTYSPNYINMSRSYLMLNEYNYSEYILKRLIKNTKSDYWRANGNMYLALVYFNGYKDCTRAKQTLQMAKILANDPEISKQYLDFERTLKTNCN
ncbi:MAG: hypothetical protein PSX42_06620 [bacterium]|nr:hypothetical protein [bacterium]